MGGELWGVGETVEIQPIGRGMTQAWSKSASCDGVEVRESWLPCMDHKAGRGLFCLVRKTWWVFRFPIP